MQLELTVTNIEKSTLWDTGPIYDDRKNRKLEVTSIMKVMQLDLKFLPTFAVTSQNH